MSTNKYKFGKGKHGTKAVNTDLPDGEHQAVAIYNLHVLVVPDGNGWFAQAFEIDYGVQGKTVEEAKKRFEEGLAATIQHNVDIFQSIDNMLHPNQDWYTMKAETEEGEYDYSCVEVFRVSEKLADRFSLIEYETVRGVAAYE
jgi:hypothetical protein